MATHKNSSGRGIHQPGQYQVVNETASVITKATAVQIVGLNGLLSVQPVTNPSTNNILGVVTDDIYPGQTGYVARMGLFGQFDTTAFSVNDVLYSDGSGALTTTPSGPQLGIVLSTDASDGHIQMDVFDNTSGGSGGHTTLITTLIQTDIDNEYILLPVSPSSVTETIVLLTGAPAQVYGDDFTVVGNQLNFNTTNPGDLGNILTAGDKITIMYK